MHVALRPDLDQRNGASQYLSNRPKTRDADKSLPHDVPEQRMLFGKRLRAWYRRNARDLPWRRTRDPYHILVSELMLQQTQVSRVVDFYDRFLRRFPTLDHLAAARPKQVREQWEGLGYYARARNLHALSRLGTRDGGSTYNGALPSEPAELR